MYNKCFEMHIFEIYVTLIAYFTICRANYLTTNIYLQVCFNIRNVKNIIYTYESDKSLTILLLLSHYIILSTRPIRFARYGIIILP